MEKQELLNTIFNQLISGVTPLGDIQLLSREIIDEDVVWMLEKIESLNDPSIYFTGTSQGDENVVSGFFLFVDLVSALIISIGESAKNKLDPYRDSNATYTPWVLKYVLDQRFHDELQRKFGLSA